MPQTEVNLYLADFSHLEPLCAGLWPSAAFRSKSQVSLSRAILANVHNVAKFRFRTSDANDARYLTQRARAYQAAGARTRRRARVPGGALGLHALLPRHYLDRAACTRARAAAPPASQLLFGAIHVSVSHLPTNISLEMYYPDTL